MTTEIESAIRATLNERDITYSAHLVQKGAKSSDGWEHDAWRITFTALDSRTYSLDYKMGIGHRKPKHNAGRFGGGYPPNTVGYAEWCERWVHPVAPEPADVLYSVVMNDPRGESFGDWCANLGYDEDSRKALETYLACQKQTEDARAFFGRDLIEQFGETLQDY